MLMYCFGNESLVSPCNWSFRTVFGWGKLAVWTDYIVCTSVVQWGIFKPLSQHLLPAVTTYNNDEFDRETGIDSTLCINDTYVPRACEWLQLLLFWLVRKHIHETVLCIYANELILETYTLWKLPFWLSTLPFVWSHKHICSPILGMQDIN